MRKHQTQKQATALEGSKSGNSRRQRRRWTLEQKRQLVESWHRSDLTRAQYCRQQQLPYVAFLRWIKEKETAAADGSFVEVRVASLTSPAPAKDAAGFDLAEIIAPNGWRMRLPRLLDLQALRQVMEVMAQC